MSEENEYNSEEGNSGRSLGKILLWGFLILALALSGFLFYKYKKDNTNAKGESYKSLYESVQVKFKSEREELNKQLDDIKVQLDQALEEKKGLLTDNESLKEQLDAKTLEIARKINSGGISNPKALRQAQAEIERLKGLQTMLQSQNDSISQNNRDLMARILSTEASYSEASERAKSLEDQKKVIDEKIRSSTLSVADLKVTGIRVKGAKEEETFKASRIGKLKITFTLLENELVAPGDKEITVRLIGTNQEVLTEDNPSLTDSDRLSTLKETVNYQNEQVKVSLSYNQKAAYKKGAYSIELIHNDKLMGRASFVLK